MRDGFHFDELIEQLAEKLAEKLKADSPEIQPRLLTVDQAALYLGRSREAMQHLVSLARFPRCAPTGACLSIAATLTGGSTKTSPP
jgi:hypothetical protein